MATKKKTTTATPEQEYKKELRRIKQFIYRASKRGFFWGESPIPKKPKKITTASVNKLKRITPDILYKKGEYVDIETGEIISGTKGRSLERNSEGKKDTTNVKSKKVEPRKGRKHKGAEETNKKDKKKPQKKPTQKPPTNEDESTTDDYYPTFTDIVISNFQAQLSLFPNAEGTSLLLAWLDTLIADNGREAVAQMLQEGAEQGLILTYEVVYKSTNTKTYMTEMMRYLPDQRGWYADEIMDKMEQFEWWEQPE